MIQTRKSNERGHANHGWLDTFHTFSFADYYDPNFMGFRALRVINEDKIEAGAGFPTHGHRDMEIITYIVEGALEHRDSMGNSTIIRPGEVQRMSAGTGVRHSEYNPDTKASTHLLQIWIQPEREGIAPSYGQRSFADELRSGDLILVASREGKKDSITLNQDVNIYVGKFLASTEKKVSIAPGRSVWLQTIRGQVTLNGISLSAGDGAAAVGERELTIASPGSAELIVFDLP